MSRAGRIGAVESQSRSSQPNLERSGNAFQDGKLESGPGGCNSQEKVKGKFWAEQRGLEVRTRTGDKIAAWIPIGPLVIAQKWGSVFKGQGLL